jgi:hypothetical protein
MPSAGGHSIQSICFAGPMRRRAPYRGDDETSMPTASAFRCGRPALAPLSRPDWAGSLGRASSSRIEAALGLEIGGKLLARLQNPELIRRSPDLRYGSKCLDAMGAGSGPHRTAGTDRRGRRISFGPKAASRTANSTFIRLPRRRGAEAPASCSTHRTRT